MRWLPATSPYPYTLHDLAATCARPEPESPIACLTTLSLLPMILVIPLWFLRYKRLQDTHDCCCGVCPTSRFALHVGMQCCHESLPMKVFALDAGMPYKSVCTYKLVHLHVVCPTRRYAIQPRELPYTSVCTYKLACPTYRLPYKSVCNVAKEVALQVGMANCDP